ncbi:hypothetical protein BDQ12DRAFT_672671 [Crucibulum laeve]|uniref:ML-like domain-containing protein n=1 Tax=Crucibulum laeve TaxID=68775 RepID=A0A5C3MHX2_9AGAR|nr:hypothetical protein BDQ12DRAFT_672671 [Crucibulum laeve]
MFSLLARLRALAFTLLLFTSVSYSREESLFTSSVTYCNPPETLLIQRFDIAYFVKNQSVSFNISAASVQANVNVTANLFLNVYGMSPVNVTLDLCNILGGALCPLPMYNFTGSDSLSLPDSLGINDNIPGIAFKIPDLEGFAQLTLTEVGTGKIKACVQATLSNGWSAHQPAVEWTTGGIAIAALVSAAWQSASPHAITPFRLLDLMYMFQVIASSSFLNLNYPSLYRAFTLNFSWALGLFYSSTPSSLQNSIDRMRHLTGGKLADASSGSAVGLVNRKLSPYNVPNANIAVIPSGIFARESKFAFFDSILNLEFPPSLKPNVLARRSAIVGGDVQTVTDDSSNVLQAGVPIYVNSIHIATANAFMTVFLVTLIMFAIALGVFIIGYGILIAFQRVSKKSSSLNSFVSFDYSSFIRAWILRLGMIASLPLLIFIFYQWTLKDSWLSIFLSVITFIAILSLILYPTFLTMRLARRSTQYELYSATEPHLASYGPLYAQYRVPRYYFFLPLLVATFLRALFITVAKKSGLVQLILLLIVEVALVTSHFILRPYKTKGGDVFSTFLAIVRLVCTGMMIAFVQRLEVKAIPRVVIGIIIAIIFSVSVIVVIINLVLHAGVQRLWRKKSAVGSGSGSSASILDSPHGSRSMLEKGIKEESNQSRPDMSPASSWERVTRRPVNPTPEQNIPLDSHILEPYPISPTGSTVTTMEPPSMYSRDSGTLTVGSLLPRRWSFSFSQPTSPTGSSSASHGQRDSARTSQIPHSPMYSVAEGIEEPVREQRRQEDPQHLQLNSHSGQQ